MSAIATVIAATRRTRRTGPIRWRTGPLIAALTLAGGIHLLLAPEHFEESTVMGVGFIGSSIVEFGLAVALLVSRHRLIYFAVVLVATSLIALYAYNVLVGLPFGEASPGSHAVMAAGEHGDDADHGEHGSEQDVSAHEADGHHHEGLSLGDGEAVDALGATTKLSEGLAIGLAAALLLQSSHGSAGRNRRRMTQPN
jgi:hypothetical protein